MCRHIRYMFAQCPNSRYKYASIKDTPICIGPCTKAYNDKGELDHAKFSRCPDFTLETVKIRSGCTMRCSTHCIKPGPSLPPNDPRFEFLIEQPNGTTMHMFGSTLPRLEDMVWYIPDKVPMNDSNFRPFSWAGSRKRKAKISDGDEAPTQATAIEDEAYLRGAEPLSPKSLPVTLGTVSEPSPSATPEEPDELTRHLSRRVSKISAPASSTATPIDPSDSAERESVPVPSTAPRPLGNKRPERPLLGWAMEARRARERLSQRPA